jgi:hypothetical protein
MTSPGEWLEPWYPVSDPSICAGLENQLRLEISDRHVLAGERARLIGRRSDTDDALFELQDGRIAEVHMTWRTSTEPDPRWPATAIFGSLEEWRRNSMIPLHEELSTIHSRRT